MKDKIVSIFWGVVLIAVSGLLLAQVMGYIEFDLFSDQFWVLALAVASAAFFLSYFLNGVQKWGWLFPAFIFAAIALTTWLATHRMEGSFLGTPILAAIALPFFVGFALDRKRWGLLIPAFVLTVCAIITLIADSARGEWIGALVQFSIGLPFLIVYLVDRKQRWALIPAFVMFTITAITLLSGFARGEWIGALVMYAIGLPFLVIYLADRKKRWALIPAGVMAILGTIPLFSAFASGDVVGLVAMLLFSAPFFVLYFWSKHNWWALIPAGVFASIAAVVLLNILFPNRGNELTGLFSGVLLLGFAVTFGILWLRRKTQPTDWAKYPAIALLAGAVLAVLLGAQYQKYSAPLILLIIGVALLLTAFTRKKAPAVPPPPEEKPAEKPVDTEPR